MEPNTDTLPASETPASASSDAGRVVLADFHFKLETTLSEERKERERHQQAIAGIIARRDKLTNAIEALREFYPEAHLADREPAADAVTSTGGHIAIIAPKASFGSGITPDNQDAGQSDDTDVNGGFARGEMKRAMLDVLAKADTFLTTDEIASALRDRFPDKKFSNKRVTDALKDNRRRKDIIGENVFRGNFPMFINGLPHFYADLETLELKQHYNEKYEQRMAELGFTPGPLLGPEAVESSALAESQELVETEERQTDNGTAVEVTSEEVAHAEEILRRPKAALGLF